MFILHSLVICCDDKNLMVMPGLRVVTARVNVVVNVRLSGNIN